MIGQTISHYRIVKKLGEGGMGVVYGAQDTRLDRLVALKFLPSDFSGDEETRQRFAREARAASALNHPHICTIHDIGEHDGRPYMVMELIKGVSLRERVADGPLKVKEILTLGIQLADALDAAHAQGILHRDVKPANIIVTDRGQAKLLDFGLAKWMGSGPTWLSEGKSDTDLETMPGTMLGTVAYMSPEQARGEDLDARTDIFSLGAVLYEMSTGRPAFGGATSPLIFDKILHLNPVVPVHLNPEIPLPLQEIITNALEKDRELRYQHAADMVADLKRTKRSIELERSDAHRSASGSGVPSGSGVAVAWDVGHAETVSEPDEPTLILRPTSSPSSPQPAPARGRALLFVTASLVAVVLAAIVLFGLPALRQEAPDADALAVPSTDTVAASRPESAAGGLEGEEVLTFEPPGEEERRIGDETESVLREQAESVREKTVRAHRAAEAGGASSLEVFALAVGLLADAEELFTRGEFGIAEEGFRQAQSLFEQARRTSAALAAARSAEQEALEAERARRAAGELASSRLAAAEETAAQAAELPPPAEILETSAAVTVAPAPSPVDLAKENVQPAEPERALTATPIDDEGAIRKVLAAYERAIETKDLALFRSLKPNLSSDEESRLQAGFSAVDSQQVEITILSMDVEGASAIVRLTRLDTIEINGSRQTTSGEQRFTLSKTDSGWVIVTIGRE